MSTSWASLIELADAAGIGQMLRQMHEASIDERCVVAFLGEFSRGKSSVINELIGADVLPVSVRPCSAGVVTIEHAESERALLHGPGGSRPIPAGTAGLGEVQTRETGGTSTDAPRVWAELHLVLPSVLQGVRLVDTPGVNDLGETAPELVYRLLPHVDLAVYVLEAPAGLTRTEAEFITDQSSRVPDVPVVIFFNKLDRLEADEPEEEAELIDELTAEAVALLPGAAVLFGSARGGLCDLGSQIVELASDAVNRRQRRLLLAAESTLRRTIQIRLVAYAEHDDTARRELARLADTAPALESAFAAFRQHLRRQGEVPLRAMVRRSLQTWRAEAERDLRAQVDLAPDPSRFAEYGLSLAVERSARAWCDRHIGPVRAFLQRHGRMALAEAQRTFGSDTALRFDADAVFLSLSPQQEGIQSTVTASAQPGVAERYGVAAAGSVIAGLIAAPLAVVGFAAGLILVERARQATQLQVRQELHTCVPMLLEHASTRLESAIFESATLRFSELDRALDAALRRQVLEVGAALDAARSSEDAGSGARAAERSHHESLLRRLDGGG